jgi:hypothetical protein
MTVLTKRLLEIGTTSGLLILLIMVFMQNGIAYAASQSGGGFTLQLHGAAGMHVHAQSGATPVVSTNGSSVNLTLSGTTYAVTNQNDINNQWLDVTVPQYMNLDLQVQNGYIEVDGLIAQMTISVGNGNIALNNVEFIRTSHLQVANGGIAWNYGALAGNNTTFNVGNGGYINVSHLPQLMAFQLNSTPPVTATGCSTVPSSTAVLNLTAGTISVSCVA